MALAPSNSAKVAAPTLATHCKAPHPMSGMHPTEGTVSSSARPTSPAVNFSSPQLDEACVKAQRTHALHRAATECCLKHNSGDQSKQILHRTRSTDRCIEKAPMVSTDGSHTLPHSLEKHFIPSHERLHTKQQRPFTKRKQPSSKDTWFQDLQPSTSPERRRTSHSLFRVPSRHGRVVSETTGLQQPFTTREEALWFLGLPEKARRRQFSNEEQLALIRHCKQILSVSSSPPIEPLSAPRALSDSTPQRHVESPVDTTPLSSSNERSQSLTCPDTDMRRLRSFYTEKSRSTTAPPPVETNVSPQLTPASSTHSSQHREGTPKGSWRHPSLRPIPLPPPKLAPPLPSHTIRNFSTPFRVERTLHEQHTSSIRKGSYIPSKEISLLQRAKTQPAASLAQSFDETDFEFPFPSPDTTPTSSPHMSSFLDSHDDDEGSMETHGPQTPPPDAFHVDTYKEVVMRENSMDRPYGTPPATDHFEKSYVDFNMQNGNYSNPHSTSWRSGFHSGLHALPEDDSEASHSAGSSITRSDPLSLDALTVSDDQTGAHGAFAVHDHTPRKGIKKVLKKMVSHSG